MAILENRAFGVIWAIPPKTSHFTILVIFGQPSPNQGGSPEKKSNCGLARINKTELGHFF